MSHEKGIEAALDFEGVAGFLSDLMDDVRHGHTFDAKEQAEILINLACEPLRRGRPILAAQPTSEGEERDREKFKEALSDYWREVADNRHDDNDGFETAAFHRVMELWEQARSSREGGK